MEELKKNIMDLVTCRIGNVSEYHLVLSSQASLRLTISEQLIQGDLPGMESALYPAFRELIESLYTAYIRGNERCIEFLKRPLSDLIGKH